MFQPRQAQESAVIDNRWALQTDRPVARGVYHRLLGHAIFTMLLAALAVVEIWYMLPQRSSGWESLAQKTARCLG
jgi:hypothetical protein